MLYNQVISELQECLDICNQDSRLEAQVREYEKILLRVENIVTDPDLPHLHFVKAINKFDEMRNTDFHKIFPELKPFWDFCNV